ncbi:MAG TPA: ATP-binding protein [Rhodoferax sp.]
MEDLMPLAQAKEIDLGMLDSARDPVTSTRVRVEQNDLRILIKNLVDHAIRYAPHGEQVDVSVTQVNDKVRRKPACVLPSNFKLSDFYEKFNFFPLRFGHPTVSLAHRRAGVGCVRLGARRLRAPGVFACP